MYVCEHAGTRVCVCMCSHVRIYAHMSQSSMYGVRRQLAGVGSSFPPVNGSVPQAWEQGYLLSDPFCRPMPFDLFVAWVEP